MDLNPNARTWSPSSVSVSNDKKPVMFHDDGRIMIRFPNGTVEKANDEQAQAFLSSIANASDSSDEEDSDFDDEDPDFYDEDPDFDDEDPELLEVLDAIDDAQNPTFDKEFKEGYNATSTTRIVVAATRLLYRKCARSV